MMKHIPSYLAVWLRLNEIFLHWFRRFYLDGTLAISFLAAILSIFPLSGILAAPPPAVQVVNVRFAHYPDKLRVVIDCSNKIKFVHGFSSDRQTLTLSLEEIEWRPPKVQNWKQMDPVTGYRYTPGAAGSGRFEVLSRAPLRLISLTTLSPDSDNKNFRIVIDLAADPRTAAAPSPPPPAAPPSSAASPPPPPAAPRPPPAASPPPPPPPPPAAPPPPASSPASSAPVPPASAATAEMIEGWLDQGAKLILGNDRPPDYPQAIALFQRAAGAGSPLGAFNIAELHRTGKGVPQSFGQAAEWYEKASQKGFAPAEYYLGALLYSGTGVPQDQQRALLLLASAASKGYGPAQVALDELKRKAEKPAAPGGQ